MDDATPSTPPNNYGGTAGFSDVSCSSERCVAVGSYLEENLSSNFQLAAESVGNSTTWNYVIDSSDSYPTDEIGGQFRSVSCDGSNCIAAGNYDNKTLPYPLLAVSTSAGGSWSYVVDGSTPSTPPNNYGGQGIFVSASCSGLNCIAGGSYIDSVSGNTYPLLAASINGGQAWKYVIDSGSNALPTDYLTGNGFNSVSCTGLYCTAAGQYTSSSVTPPNNALLLESIDGGQTWTTVVDSTLPTTPPHNYEGAGIFYATATGQSGASSSSLGTATSWMDWLQNIFED